MHGVDGYYSCDNCGTPTGYYYWSPFCDVCRDERPLTQVELRAMRDEIARKAR